MQLKMVQTPYVCIIICNNISIYNYLNVHKHMYKLGLDDIGIYCHNTYFIAKSITVLLYTYHDIFLISFSAEGQLYNRVHFF